MNALLYSKRILSVKCQKNSFKKCRFSSAIHTTYVHWQIHDGKIQHRNYLSSDGSHRTSSTMAAWSWLAKNAEEAFARSAENKDAGISYPALTAQYAVLVQGSNGWNNYRHQADVLSVYQMLKTKGFDDACIGRNESRARHHPRRRWGQRLIGRLQHGLRQCRHLSLRHQ